MGQFEVRARLKIREAYVDADALVDHALHVREARDALFAEFAYDHKMAFYGDPSPRPVALVDKIGGERHLLHPAPGP